MIEGLKPYTYGYMYPDNTLRFSDREINGMRPLHPVPLYSLEQIDTLQKQLVKLKDGVREQIRPLNEFVVASEDASLNSHSNVTFGSVRRARQAIEALVALSDEIQEKS